MQQISEPVQNVSQETDIKLRCFYGTHNETIGYTIIVNGQTTGVYAYPGNVLHQPQVVEYGFHGAFVFFIDVNHNVVVMGVQTDTNYDEHPQVLSLGEFSEAPSCVLIEDNKQLFCVVRGMDGSARSLRFRHGKWEPARIIGPNPVSPIGCTVNPTARLIQCWAAYGEDSAFSERWWSLHGEVVTEKWRHFGEYSRGRPCVKHAGTVAFPRALHKDTNRMVDAFGNFGGNLHSEPDCVHADTRTYDCFALTKDQNLQRIYQYLGVFYVQKTSGWVNYGGEYHGNPSCLYLGYDQKYHCFMINKNNTLIEGTFGVVRESISKTSSLFNSLLSYVHT